MYNIQLTNIKKNNMKKIIYLLLLCLLLTNGYAQQRYAYLPEGRTTFQTSTEKIIISYKNGERPGKPVNFISDTLILQQTARSKWNCLI